VLVVGVLFVTSVCLLCIGVVTPCMGLRVNNDAFIQPNGPVPKSMAGVLDVLDLPGKLNADVSVWSCTAAIIQWACDGEAVFVVAFALITVFAVVVPVLDMMALFIATWYAYAEKSSSASARARLAIGTSQVLRHVGMLDVFCMGVGVVCLAGVAYKDNGFELSLMHGMVPLVCAEIVHAAMYQLVLYKVLPLIQSSEAESYDYLEVAMTPLPSS
jgi:hypothetical protein